MKEIIIKKPQQQRSRQKFNAVLIALPRVIQSHGFKKTTTAAIALEADISIGSLYDYFSCKEAIIAAFIEHELDTALDNVAYYAKHSALNWEHILKELVRTGIEFAQQHKDILKIVFSEQPSLAKSIDLSSCKEKITHIALDFADNTQIQITHPNIDLLLFSLTNIILGFQFRIVLMNDESFDKETLTNELTDIIKSYMQLTIQSANETNNP